MPAGDHVDLILEYQSAGLFLQHSGHSMRVPLNVRTDTGELTVWILMPTGKEYAHFRVTRYKKGKPQKVEPVRPVTQYMATDNTLIAFKLLSVDGDYNYEVSWTYK